MKVILQQDVKGQGKKGQLIEASEGYARNYLLPRKLAIAATADAINTMNLKEKARRAEEARQKEAAMAAAQAADELLTLRGVKASFVLCRKGAGVILSGRSLGEVNVQVILEALGGGGNSTTAGGQIAEGDVAEVRAKLLDVIEAYFEK